MNWPEAFVIVGVAACILYAMSTLSGPFLVGAGFFLIIGALLAPLVRAMWRNMG